MAWLTLQILRWYRRQQFGGAAGDPRFDEAWEVQAAKRVSLCTWTVLLVLLAVFLATAPRETPTAPDRRPKAESAAQSWRRFTTEAPTIDGRNP